MNFVRRNLMKPGDRRGLSESDFQTKTLVIIKEKPVRLVLKWQKQPKRLPKRREENVETIDKDIQSSFINSGLLPDRQRRNAFSGG